MDPNLTSLERAFQIAESGRYKTVAEIKKQLLTEGYSTAQITGRVLSKQLQALINKSDQSSSD